MSPGAVKALTDFVRLTAEEPSGLYFEQFLKHGIGAWPERQSRRFPGLKCWQGIAALKHSLLSLVGSPPDGQVLLSSRSAQLMELAAISQFRVCRRVLTTDLSWPAYDEILRRQASSRNARVELIPLRQSILFDRMSSSELVDQIANAYVDRGCDGLFLPAVDNLGVQLPIRQIVQAIESRLSKEVGFVVVDGAQAIGHVPLDLCHDTCDILVAGCHKWLRAYLPMGLAFYGRRRSRYIIDQTLVGALKYRQIDDPLLKFIRQIETDDSNGYLETTNISPLLSCCGAVTDLTGSPDRIREASAVRAGNAERILNALTGTGWTWLRPDDGLRSSVVLLHSQRADVRSADPDSVRAAFRQVGVSLSNYEAGLVRLSMPDIPLSSGALGRVRHAMASVN